MMGPHLSVSDLSWVLRAWGVARSWLTGSVPSSAKRSLTFGSLRAVCSAAVSLSMTGLGVPLGAYRPCHIATSKPGSPASFMVGTSGSEGTRVLVVTAYTLILPPLIWLVVLVVWSHMKSTWPPSRSFIAGPVPL